MFDSLLLQQLFTQFHFIRPWWLLLFFPLAILVYSRWYADAQHSMHDLLPKHLRKVLLVGEQGWKKQMPLKLLAFGFSMAIIICAGPTWLHESSPFGEDKATLIVVLDNSESMLEEDIAPNRLARAKHKIADLIELRKGGETGLIVFAGSAHLAMPATLDSNVFTPYLAAISPEIMPRSGKMAETALTLIDSQVAKSNGATVVLVTDGASPNTIKQYAHYFKEKQLQLLIFAIGNANIVSKVPVDLVGLRALANATGGRVVEVSTDDRDIIAINALIERHMQINGESDMPWHDMGYQLLLPIALLLLLWFRKGWLVQWCIAGVFISNLAFVAPVYASPIKLTGNEAIVIEEVTVWDKTAQWWMDLWFTADQQGQLSLNKQNYLTAAKHFDDPLRRGGAYYYATEYKLAHSAFLQTGTNLGYYNAASALARQREYLAARNLLAVILEDDNLDEQLSTKVSQNLLVIQHIIDEINRTSEDQSNSSISDGLEESLELGDAPKAADGFDEMSADVLMVKEKLNANEILGSEELANKWLRKVEADPKLFLRTKFYIQLQNEQLKGNSDD